MEITKSKQSEVLHNSYKAHSNSATRTELQVPTGQHPWLELQPTGQD